MDEMDELEYSERLDKLGRFLMQEVRDVCIGRLDGIFEPSKSSYYYIDKDLHDSLGELGEEKIKLIRNIVTVCMDNMISNLLYSFECDDEGVKGIGLSADGSDIRELGPSLQVLMHSEWIERFSKYGEWKPSRLEEY
jgi:hypothetical protein